MECHATAESVQRVAADWLVVGIGQSEEFDDPLRALDDALDGQLTRLREAGDLTGKLAETLTLPDVPALAAQRLLLVGLGPLAEVDRGSLHKAFATAAMATSKQSGRSVACLIPSIPDDRLKDTVVAHELAAALTVGCVGPGL